MRKSVLYNWRKQLLAAITVLLVAIICLSLYPQKVAAQGSPFDQILAKLDQVLAELNASSGPVVLSTGYAPAGYFNDGLAPIWRLGCNLANVTDTTITDVNFRVLDLAGTEVLTFTSDVSPGAGVSMPAVGLSASGTYRCEFRFSGRASAVRANMVVRNGAASNPTDIKQVVLEAR